MLQRIGKSKALAFFAMLVVSVILFSFSSKMGTDSFEVYINKKLVLQQYVKNGEAPKSLQLDQSNYNEVVEVYYNHCGRTGTSRSISIRDGENKILKEWHFKDSPGQKTLMACNVKDIAGLQKLNSSGPLNLYYSANELPEGRALATVVMATGIKAAP